MNNFKNIEELYKITSISDSYFNTKLNKKDERVYIFKITPLLFLDLSENVKLNLVEKYKEFLRELNFNIQILLLNKKLNLKTYIEKYFKYNENISKSMYDKYISELEKEIESENIYETNMYIIVSDILQEKTKIEEITRVILKLEELGCKVTKVTSKEEITKVLYSSLNKI